VKIVSILALMAHLNRPPHTRSEKEVRHLFPPLTFPLWCQSLWAKMMSEVLLMSSLTTEEFESFADFSRAKLATGTSNLTLDDLVIEWESLKDRGDINAAIQEGLDDAASGRHRPAHQAMADIRKKYSLPSSE
jgi:hypothetical protein